MARLDQDMMATFSFRNIHGNVHSYLVTTTGCHPTLYDAQLSAKSKTS